jgi:DUF1016 N-terminal domain
MVRLAESFVDEAIVLTLSQQLSWSHFLEILPFKDPLARDFYGEMCSRPRECEQGCRLVHSGRQRDFLF